VKVISMYFIMEDEEKFLDIIRLVDYSGWKYKFYEKYLILLDNDITKPFLLLQKIRKSKLNKYINDIVIINGGELNSSVKEILNEGE
jgi:hypothetical protein